MEFIELDNLLAMWGRLKMEYIKPGRMMKAFQRWEEQDREWLGELKIFLALLH